MSSFRILVADDHPIVRFGLSAVLASHTGWEVCGEVANGRSAVEMCRRLKPDLVVLDIGLPQLNGVDAAQQILQADPSQRILIFTDVQSEAAMRACLEAGVRGWVFKSDGTNDLKTAVEAMQQHKCVFSSRVANLIQRTYLQRDSSGAAGTIPELSPREREMVQLVAEGYSTKEVAAIFKVSIKTADSHRANIMRKLEVHSVAEWVLYAVRNGIVQATKMGVRTPELGVREFMMPPTGESGSKSRHLPGPAAVVGRQNSAC